MPRTRFFRNFSAQPERSSFSSVLRLSSFVVFRYTPPMSSLTWLEIDLSAIRNNVKRLAELAGSGAGVMAVVKANAYGHGAVDVARAAAAAGAAWLGVARPEEAVA